jgi:hypothetical protein
MWNLRWMSIERLQAWAVSKGAEMQQSGSAYEVESATSLICMAAVTDMVTYTYRTKTLRSSGAHGQERMEMGNQNQAI